MYLSGGMEYADNEGRDWREPLQSWIETNLGWAVFNPNRESDRFFEREYPSVDIRGLKMSDPMAYKKIVERLVNIDCNEIAQRSDLVVCYWDESAMRGAGTKGEVTMAKYFAKPVYMVTSVAVHDIPGWVLACTTEIFPSFEKLQKFLLATRSTSVEENHRGA